MASVVTFPTRPKFMDIHGYSFEMSSFHPGSGLHHYTHTSQHATQADSPWLCRTPEATNLTNSTIRLSETTGKKYKPLLNTLSVFAVTARMISSPLQTLPIETALGTPNRKVRRDHRTNCRARTNKTTKGI